MKYLLIDGNNLAIRASFANSELKNSNGDPTGVHFGTFSQIIALKESYPEHKLVMFWDGKSKRRIAETTGAVENKIIPSIYKANRKKEEYPQPLLDFFSQAPMLKRAIGKTDIPQIRFPDYETDDLIAAYTKKLKANNEILISTTDEDYFQLLDPAVRIWNGMKQIMITEDTFKDEYKITPSQYVDVGAFSGDTGDNIFGVPGWGDKTALKAIQEQGSWKATLNKFHEELDPVRVEYPDLTGDSFKALASIATPSGKAKYTGIYQSMPFTGVALALENTYWKPKEKSGAKNRVMALMFEERVALAYSLKKMDDEIADLPELSFDVKCDKDRLMEYFDYYDIETLKPKISIFE